MMSEWLNNLSIWLVIFCIGGACYLRLERLWKKLFGKSNLLNNAAFFHRITANEMAVFSVNENIGATFNISGYGSVYLGGKPDMVWSTKEGLLVPVEFRSRHCQEIRQSDIDQLSLAAWVLRQNGHRTAEFGVLVFDKRSLFGRSSRPVYLRSNEACEALVRRYLEIIDGKRPASRANNRRCRSCAHLHECKPLAVDDFR